MAHDDAGTPVTLPASFTVEWALSLTEKLDAASQHGNPAALRAVLPVEVLIGLWQAATTVLAAEPTLLEVSRWTTRDMCKESGTFLTRSHL